MAAKGPIRARNSDVSYAIAAILALGAVALFALPPLGHAIGLTDPVGGPLVVAVIGLTVVASVSLGLVLFTSRVLHWGVGG